MTSQGDNHLRTAQVATQAGIHRDTLLRWLREGKVPEPRRDVRGWRVFTQVEATAVAKRARTGSWDEMDHSPAQAASILRGVDRLRELDWDFVDAKTDYLSHGLHPYPAKYIPQIPNALIQELSSVEERVADVFCGSGTTLVEALSLKRHVVGVDASPIACLISEAKTTRLTPGDEDALRGLVSEADATGNDLLNTGPNSPLYSPTFESSAPRPEEDDSLLFWFDDFIVEELAEVLSWCRNLDSEPSRTIALAAFSAIIVGVSKQDSDTRYVRRQKNLKPGDVFRRFVRSLKTALQGVIEFGELVEPRFHCRVVNRSILERPEIGIIDAVVCSPPYPNAWSYHLYHRTRMVWLGMDQPRFKREEIGSHRKYSRKVPTEDKIRTFRQEMLCMFDWLRSHLRQGRYAAFVIGDSIVDGKVVDNADILAETASQHGFREAARIDRTILSTKKAFNPKIGKIRKEQVLILQSTKGVRV